MKKQSFLRWTSLLLLIVLLFGGCGNTTTPVTTADLPTVATTAAPETTQTPAETDAPPETTDMAPETTVAELPTETTVAEVMEVQPGGVYEDGEYSSKDEVASYIHEFGHLPSNYITKKQAQALGWDSSKGNLWDVAPGKSIGGDYFGNYEGLLPKAKGREYHECDIDFEGGYRGAKRIIFSNDGLIFYTEDHYETFEQLFAED